MAEVAGKEVILTKGATFREPDGTSWKRGGLRLITDSTKLAYYKSNSRFVVREPGSGAPKIKEEERKPRTRAEMRERTAERTVQTPPPVSKIPEKVKPKFSDEAVAAAKLVVDEKLKIDHLRRIAKAIGAYGPSGTPPEMAKKKELVGWIRTRQAEILSEVQVEPEVFVGDQDVSVVMVGPDGVEVLHPTTEDDQDLGDDLELFEDEE